MIVDFRFPTIQQLVLSWEWRMCVETSRFHYIYVHTKLCTDSCSQWISSIIYIKWTRGRISSHACVTQGVWPMYKTYVQTHKLRLPGPLARTCAWATPCERRLGMEFATVKNLRKCRWNDNCYNFGDAFLFQFKTLTSFQEGVIMGTTIRSALGEPLLKIGSIYPFRSSWHICHWFSTLWGSSFHFMFIYNRGTQPHRLSRGALSECAHALRRLYV